MEFVAVTAHNAAAMQVLELAIFGLNRIEAPKLHDTAPSGVSGTTVVSAQLWHADLVEDAIQEFHDQRSSTDAMIDVVHMSVTDFENSVVDATKIKQKH